MMNCVLTHAMTVTPSRSMSDRAPSAVKRPITTVGQPRIVGVKCDVQSPNPNGAGMRLMHTSSAW